MLAKPDVGLSTEADGLGGGIAAAGQPIECILGRDNHKLNHGDLLTK